MRDGKQFRIYPSRDQQKTLSQWIGHQRFIYNAKLGEDRYFRKFAHKALALTGEEVPCDQQYSQFIAEETAFLKEVPSQILRNGAYRWMTAYQRFFKKVAKGRPTIKKKTGRQSVLITKELFSFYSIDKKMAMIRLGTKKFPLGDIPVNVHQDYAIPNTICISVHGGKWHVSFRNDDGGKPLTTEVELLVALEHLTEDQLAEVATGFDRNVVIPVAASNGVNYDFTQEQKESIDKATAGKVKWQKRFARRSKGSSNRRKAVKQIAKYDRKVADIRKDFAHKTSKAIVEAPGSLIVFEDLKVKNMTASAKGTAEAPGKHVSQKAGLNRSILKSCWGYIKNFTHYKGLRNGKLTIVVPAAYSSQECSQCGHTHKDSRPDQATFICQSCDYTCNADYNASVIIKKRGVRAVLDGKVSIKVSKRVAFTKESRRAGAVQTDALARAA